MSTLIQALHEKALQVAQDFKRAEAALINIIQEVDRHRVFLHHGQTSLFGYCTQVLGLSSDVTFNAITVARKAVAVPELKKEIESGNLSISTARKITPVITKENQSTWIEKAETLTVRELEREVARVAPKTATPERAKYVSEDRVQLSLGVSESLMKKIRRVQDLLSQKERRSVSLEEAFEKMAEGYLEKNDPVRKAERVEAKRPLDTSPVTGQVGGRRIPIPAAIRHKVELRDQRQCGHRDEKGKRCENTRFLDYHHKISVQNGGEHSVQNLVTLCSAHHRNLHSKV